MSDDLLKTELTIAKGNVVGKFDEVPRSVLQALYAAVATVTDKITDKKRRPAVYSIEDLEQLVLQLDQWTRPYTPIAKNLKIVVRTYEEGAVVAARQFDFHDFTGMKLELQSRTDRVKSVIVSFDFLYQDANSGKAQPCELVVELAGRTQRSFYSVSDANPIGGKALSYGSQFTVKITVAYSDLIVARGVQGVAANWYENLEAIPFPQIGWLRRYLHDYDGFDSNDQLNVYLNFFPIIFGASASIVLAPRLLNLTSSQNEVPFWVVLIVFFSLIFRGFFPLH